MVDTESQQETHGEGGSPRIVSCEAQGPIAIPLEEVLDPSGELRINPDTQRYFDMYLKKGSLSLRARGCVGYIPISDRVVVQVEPRVPVRDLSRIIRISGVPPTPLGALRNYATSKEWSDTLLDLYAGKLISDIEKIVASGLLREYTEQRAISSFPRGRVRLSESIQVLSSRGNRHAAVISWHERSLDNPPNRCLKYAVWLIAQRYMQLQPKDAHSRALHKRLSGLYSLFEGVQLDQSLTFLEDGRVRGVAPLPSSRAYYREALDVAIATIEQRSVLIEDSTGPLRMPSIVVDMDTVFEAFIRNVLREHATTNGWSATVLDGNKDGQKDLYNERPSPPANPDIVVRSGDGMTALIIEIKNVPVKDASSRGAVHQAVTYALSYRAKRVVLVHPRGRVQTPGVRYVGDIKDVSVYQYRFDLDAEDLVGAANDFGQEIALLLA